MLIRYLWPPTIWTLLILVLTLIPGESLPSIGFFQIDKLVHIFFFSVLMILSSYSFQKIGNGRLLVAKPVMIAFIYSMGLGIVIEILQLFVPGRSFSLADIAANSIGALSGYLIFIFLRKMMA